MGYDASCTLRVDGTSAHGTAWLEHKDLVFRGPRRLVIPLSSITSATAVNGVLRVRFADRSAEFEIGDSAAKWAARITNPPSRLDKLGVKTGMKILVIGLQDEPFLSELAARSAQVASLRLASLAQGERRASGSGTFYDLLFYAAEDRKSLERLTALKSRIQPNGAVWILRPKGQKAITESDTMAAGRRAGLVDVKVVSFSDTYSAEKFVIPVSKRRNSRGSNS
jgi:hypothetical protein